MNIRITVAVLLGVTLLAGCRGMETESPPVHLNLNMDFQQKFDPQERNPFFADKRAMRPLVPGTVARGTLKDDSNFYAGRTEAGEYVGQGPMPMTRALLSRGLERYNIYCTPCHGMVGDGDGLVTTGGYGFAPAPSFHDDRLREVPDGYIYDVITNGVRTMPAYGSQIPVADRWAIVAYVRALQRSQHATESDIPAGVLPEVAAQSTAGAQTSAE